MSAFSLTLSLAKKINPRTSLFAKIFIWFWLASLVLIIGSMYTVRTLVGSAVQFQVLPEIEQHYLNEYVSEIKRSLSQGHPSNNSRVEFINSLQQYARQNMVPMLIVDDQGELHTLAPAPAAPNSAFLADLIEASSPVLFSTQVAEIRGPIAINFMQQQAHLFFLKPRPFSWLIEKITFHPGVIFALAVLLSLFFCYWLSHSITKPIKRLRTMSKELIEGSWDNTSYSKTSQKDEIGQLTQDVKDMALKFEGFIRNNERLLADVSHDLQSPVGRQRLAINMFESWLKHSAVDAQRAEYLLGVIKKENRLISTMLNDLMTYTEIKNMNHLRKLRFDLSALLRSMVADMEFTLTSQGKTIDVSIVSQGELYGDQSLVYRAIDNVLVNASRFAKTNVRVSLEWVTIDETKFARVKIVDDGPGIDNQKLNAICEPFYRLDDARNHQNKHLGIGLSITKQIIDLHSGKLEIGNNPNPDLGLEVSLLFPIQLD